MLRLKTIQVRDNEGREYEYGINNVNEGLWCDGKQCMGTADFYARNKYDLMRKLKKADIESGLKMIRNSGHNYLTGCKW